MPYPPSWYPTQHCFWSRNSLHSKTSVAIGPCSGIHWCYPGSRWSSCLDKTVDWPFKDPVPATSEWWYFSRLRKCCVESWICSRLCPIWCCLPWPVLAGHEREVGIGVPSLTTSLVLLLHNFLLCLSSDLSLNVLTGRPSNDPMDC